MSEYIEKAKKVAKKGNSKKEYTKAKMIVITFCSQIM